MLPTENEAEDLRALLASPGWARFRAFCSEQWGPEGFRQKARRIMGNAKAAPADVLSQHMLQLEAATTAAENLVRWPQDRLKRLDSTTRANVHNIVNMEIRR